MGCSGDSAGGYFERVLSNTRGSALRAAAEARAQVPRGDPVVELDTSESVPVSPAGGGGFLEDQGQPAGAIASRTREVTRRLGRSDRAAKGAGASARPGRSSRKSSSCSRKALVSQDALRRTLLGELRQSRCRARAATATSGRTPSGPRPCNWKGSHSERGSLDKERAGAAAPRPVDHESESRRRPDLGLVTGGVLVRRGDVIANIAASPRSASATVSDIHSGGCAPGWPPSSA